MIELVKNILINPLWTIVTTIILWIVIYQLLKFFKLSEKNWKRLEYIWIFIGLIGVLSIIEKNKKEFRAVDNYYLKQEIKYNLSNINYLLSDFQSCKKFTKLASSPADFDDLQYDQDLICSWSNQYKIDIDTLEGIPTKPIDNKSINFIKLKTSFMNDYVKEFNSYCYLINKDIEVFNKNRQEINSCNWEEFNRTLGVLLIILAFSIRLSITTKNVRIINNK